MKNTIDKVGCSTLSKAALTAVILASMTMGANAADTYQLDEVVVTATKTENTIKDVPEQTEVFTQKDFKQLGAQDVRGALKLATSLDTSDSGMVGNAVSIRGMGTNRTLVLVDGRRMASEDTSETANVYELNRISLSNVDRIEVVRGNSSALYGSDALGGVINIITKRPTEAGLTVGANTGSHVMNNYYHYDLGQIGKFNGSFDVNFQKAREYSFSDEGSTMMYGPRQNFSFDGEYKLSENRGIGMNLSYMKDRMRIDYADDAATEYTGTDGNTIYAHYAKDKYQNIDSTRKSASFDYHAKTTYSDFMIRAYYNQLDKDSKTYNRIELRNTPVQITTPLGTMTMPMPVGYVVDKHLLYDYDNAKYDTFVLEGRDTTRLSDAHRLTIGGEYRNLQYKGSRLNDGNKENIQRPGDPEFKKPIEKELNLTAFYVQDEWTPTEKLIITPSVRYDHSDKFGSNVAPKIGLTYKFQDNLRFKANYGRGFRAPTLSELYMYFDGSSMAGMPGAGMFYISGNPDLKPEKSLGYDFSLEWEPGRAFSSLSYYHNRVNNLIAIPPDDKKTVQQYINIGQAKMEGVEAMVGYHLNDNWTVKGTWNYLSAIDEETGERISGTSAHYGTAQLLYDDNQNYGWSGVLWYEFTNDYLGSDESGKNPKNYSYNLLNLSISKRWGDRVTAFVGLDNITNKKSDMGIYLDGRLWRTGVEWKF